MADSTVWDAGPDLDAQIARLVFAERIGQYETEAGPHHFIASYGLARDIPPFSTDIAAAWTVVEHLRDGGYLVRVVEHPESSRPDSEHRHAWRERRAECVVEQHVRGVRRRAGAARASTAALAICRAGLASATPGP